MTLFMRKIDYASDALLTKEVSLGSSENVFLELTPCPSHSLLLVVFKKRDDICLTKGVNKDFGISF